MNEVKWKTLAKLAEHDYNIRTLCTVLSCLNVLCGTYLPHLKNSLHFGRWAKPSTSHCLPLFFHLAQTYLSFCAYDGTHGIMDPGMHGVSGARGSDEAHVGQGRG